jgi:hypothetical protein
MLESVFPADAYLVRFGKLAAARGAGCLLAGAAVIAYAILAHGHVIGDVLLTILAAGVAGYGVTELRKAARREVAFAVDQAGIYFGSEAIKDRVPWQVVCSVEFFTERVSSGRSTSTYRCVGVRSLGSAQHARAGNGPAAQPLPEKARQYYLSAGRPDLIPGADGTIRYAYRRMSGWRVNPAQLAAAVNHFAPGVPVINGPSYPPPITGAEAMAARRARHQPGSNLNQSSADA